MKTKFSLVLVLMMTVFTTAFVACSSDDDNPEPDAGNIDVAIGTFKGTIDIVGSGGVKHFDQLVEVTKVNDKTVKVTVKNTDLGLPVKEVGVSSNYTVSVQSLATDPQGIFIYTIENKALSFTSKITAEGEEMYSFEGIKQ